ncbi:MAG: hypothetical protein KA066_00690 [Candidatus Pacebacteria bacterium]|nr:hypothetical protein [Candidatus Paceibacterota bacterium]
MPPKRNLSGQPHPADEAWRNPPPSRYYGNRPPVGSMSSQGSGFKKGRETAGPMAVQQQQQAREPHQQRLVPQRNSGTKVQV